MGRGLFAFICCKHDFYRRMFSFSICKIFKIFHFWQHLAESSKSFDSTVHFIALAEALPIEALKPSSAVHSAPQASFISMDRSKKELGTMISTERALRLPTTYITIHSTHPTHPHMTHCKIEFTYASHCVSKNLTPRRMLKNVS